MEIFAESLCGITHGRLLTLGRRGHYYRLLWADPLAGQCLALHHLGRAGALLLHNMPFVYGRLTLTQMGLVVEGCSTEEKIK